MGLSHNAPRALSKYFQRLFQYSTNLTSSYPGCLGVYLRYSVFPGLFRSTVLGATRGCSDLRDFYTWCVALPRKRENTCIRNL